MTVPAEDPPPWDRLPHDPAGFFGLVDPIDRKELKRAYNRLLRRFKPEKAPEEFQRIRAAYEALDERLRYGDQAIAPFTQTVAWAEDDQPEAPQPFYESTQDASLERQAPKPKSLAQRLETESPQALYQELKANKSKTPFDYYALALLSDIVEKRKPLRFAEWLLSGVKSHPDDGALWRLLHDYLRGPLPPGREAKLLPVIAQVAKDDSFYALTEPLWMALLRQSHGTEGVERFAVLLRQCEAQLRDTQITGKLTFYIQLAKAAMLVGEHPWPSEAVDYIESNFEQVPPWMEQELDMLGLLREYVAVRQEFIAGHPLCRQMDQAMGDYFLQDQSVGDRGIVATQIAIAEDLVSLQAAFPIEASELHSALYPLWMWVTWDVGERTAAPVEEQDREIDWAWRVRELMEVLSAKGNRSSLGLKWTAMIFAYRCVQGAAYVLPCVALVFLVFGFGHQLWPGMPGEVVLVVVCLIIALTIFAGYKVSNWVRNRFWSDYCSRISSRIYNTLWRPMILDFQQRSHLESQEFRYLFQRSVNEAVPLSDYINAYVQQDFAPAVLAQAQRFLA